MGFGLEEIVIVSIVLLILLIMAVALLS